MTIVATTILILCVLGMSFVSAFAALYALDFMRRRSQSPDIAVPDFDNEIVFLFDGTLLVDATPGGRKFLNSGQAHLPPWQRLLAVVHKKYPDFETSIAALEHVGELSFQSTHDNARLFAEWQSGLTRITIQAQLASDEPHEADDQSIASINDELSVLQKVVDETPMAVWREDRDGSVRWANAFYLDLIRQAEPENDLTTWPLPKLFEDHQLAVGSDETRVQRLTLPATEHRDEAFFDCLVQRHEGDLLVFARPMDQLIRAERALQEFVQTLTKTFGDLPTGLAVFNRKRELVLFNPALTDLTSLKPLFLSTQPTLFAFLDQLRNKQRMPEPKDYKTWRQGIIDLEAAAEQGTYHEDWYLPTGQTYRVTGQPHPDGAIAFLFEDISAEVSLTRRFRTEVELGQAVIDSLDEAIAILSRDGTVTLSNQAYADLWGTNPTEALGEIRLKDVLQNWTNTCHSTGFWDELIAYHNDESARAPKTAELQMRDGRCLICRLAPVAGAAMLVGFTVVSNSGNSVRGVTHPPRKAAT